MSEIVAACRPLAQVRWEGVSLSSRLLGLPGCSHTLRVEKKNLLGFPHVGRMGASENWGS